MIKDESAIIDSAFEKEIGVNIGSAIKFLVTKGISIENMEKIANTTKDVVSDEIDKRNIPYEYRFLLLNVTLCELFKTATSFHKAWVKRSEESPEYIYKKGFDIKFVKEK